MDALDTFEGDASSLGASVAAILGIKGSLRFRPHGSTQKAHVVLRRVTPSDDSSNDGEMRTVVRFSLFAQKRIEVRAGKEILLTVSSEDPRFNDQPIVFEGDLEGQDIGDDEEEETQVADEEDEEELVLPERQIIPPKMRRDWTKKVEEVSPNIHTYASVGVHAEPSSLSIAIQAQPLCSSASVQAELTSTSVAVQVNAPSPPQLSFGVQVPDSDRYSSSNVQTESVLIHEQKSGEFLSEQEKIEVVEAEQRVERSLSPMELESPRSSSPASPTLSPLYSPAHIFSPISTPKADKTLLICHSPASSIASSSGVQDMAMSPSPPPIAVENPISQESRNLSKVADSLVPLRSPHAWCPTQLAKPPTTNPCPEPPFQLKHASSRVQLDLSATASSLYATPMIKKKEEIPNPFVRAKHSTGPTSTIQDKSQGERLADKVYSEEIGLNPSSSSPHPSSPSRLPSVSVLQPPSSTSVSPQPVPARAVLEKASVESTKLPVQQNPSPAPQLPPVSTPAPPQLVPARAALEKAPEEYAKPSVRQSPSPASQLSPALTPAPPPPPPPPPQLVSTRAPDEKVRLQFTKPLGQQNAVASGSKLTSEKPIPSYTYGNIPVGPRSMVGLSSRAQEKSPALSTLTSSLDKVPQGEAGPRSPPPDPKVLAYIHSGPSSNPLGIRPAAMSMLPKMPPSAPKALAQPVSKKRIVVGTGWSAARGANGVSTASANINSSSSSASFSTVQSITNLVPPTKPLDLGSFIEYSSPSPPPLPSEPPPPPPSLPPAGKWKKVGNEAPPITPAVQLQKTEFERSPAIPAPSSAVPVPVAPPSASTLPAAGLATSQRAPAILAPLSASDSKFGSPPRPVAQPLQSKFVHSPPPHFARRNDPSFSKSEYTGSSSKAPNFVPAKQNPMGLAELSPSFASAHRSVKCSMEGFAKDMQVEQSLSRVSRPITSAKDAHSTAATNKIQVGQPLSSASQPINSTRKTRFSEVESANKMQVDEPLSNSDRLVTLTKARSMDGSTVEKQVEQLPSNSNCPVDSTIEARSMEGSASKKQVDQPASKVNRPENSTKEARPKDVPTSRVQGDQSLSKAVDSVSSIKETPSKELSATKVEIDQPYSKGTLKKERISDTKSASPSLSSITAVSDSSFDGAERDSISQKKRISGMNSTSSTATLVSDTSSDESKRDPGSRTLKDPAPPQASSNNPSLKVPAALSRPSPAAQLAASAKPSQSSVPPPLKHPLPPKPVGVAASTGPAQRRGVKRDRPGSPDALENERGRQRKRKTYRWPTVDSNLTMRLQGEGDLSVRSISFASDGSHFAIACGDSTIRIWNNRTRVEIARLSHNSCVVSALWMEGDAGVIALSEDGLVSKWTRSGRNFWHWAKILDAGTAGLADGEKPCFAYHQDRIAVAYPTTGVKIWMWLKGSWQVVQSITCPHVSCIRFIQGTDTIVGGTDEGAMVGCEVPNGILRAFGFLASTITSIEANAIGSHILVGQLRGPAQLIKLKTRDSNDTVEKSYVCKEMEARSSKGFGAVFATKGQAILYGDVDGCALVWDRKKGAVVYGLEHDENDPIVALASFDGQDGCLLTGSKCGQISWWSQPVAAAVADDPKRKKSSS